MDDPKIDHMIDMLLSFPGHIIATMRTATEWTVSQYSNGKSAPQRIGLAPVQGKGFEYEFDMLMEISPEHAINVIKDRTGKFQDRIIQDPGEAFGKEILAWLNEGDPMEIVRTKEDLIEFGKPLGMTAVQIGEALKIEKLQFNPAIWEEMKKAVVSYANGNVELAVN